MEEHVLRLFIVDDNAGYIQAARDFLQRQGAEVVGIASDAAEAVRLAPDLRPDCVLVDIELGLESGFDVATRLTTDHGQRVVLISVHSESEFAEFIASSPALGFIPKADISLRRIADVLADAGRSET